LLFFSALAFVWLNKQGLYPPELKSVNLDFEFLFRKLMPSVGKRGFAAMSLMSDTFIDAAKSGIAKLPVMGRNVDPSAATLTLRMVIGFVLLVLIALVTELV
jgi:multicomponent Na+:H+ antiporter subunit D